MHYFYGILLALALALLAYYAVIAGISMVMRGLGDHSPRFPVLPKLSKSNPVPGRSTDFARFIVERFDPGHFRLVHWHKKNDSPAVTGVVETGPELEYEALVHTQVIPFAVACEWRPGFRNGVIDFPVADPFPRYREFSSQSATPVFLIIGVGGTESEPGECYVLPLDVVLPHFTYLSRKFLDHYRRPQPDSVLFLDTNQMILR